jgi:hypothetical protein
MKWALLVLLLVIGGFYLLATYNSSDASSSETKKPEQQTKPLKDFIADDVQCGRPYDMMTPQGRAVADFCNASKNTNMKSEEIVALEIAAYKLGYSKLSAYSQWLVDHDSGLRHYLESREK